MTTAVDKRLQIREGIVSQVSDEIREAYLSDPSPWVVGFSGGKDSTAMLQIIYYVLAKLPRSQVVKPLYVLASDTRVETPMISSRVRGELLAIENAAERDRLPITCALVYPKLNDTFWVNLIGRGYPSPNAKFRWCTDRLKIQPISGFIERMIDQSGDVVIALGARKAESSTRAQTMEQREIKGNRFRPHVSMLKAWVYAPIEDLSTNEVWTYLLNAPSPWGGNNRELVGLYKQASGGECPLVIDASTPSCGQSRFGCWTCTVVDKDRSMEFMVENGEDHLEPLLAFRDYLKEVRDAPGARYDVRRNGTTPYRRGTDEAMNNTGPFRHAVRRDLLRRLLHAQKESGITLIEGDELAMIREIWSEEEKWHPAKPDVAADTVVRIWKHVFEEAAMPGEGVDYDYLDKENQLLLDVCRQEGVEFEMLRRLRDIEEQYGHLKRRHGLLEEMRDTIREYSSESEGGDSRAVETHIDPEA